MLIKTRLSNSPVEVGADRRLSFYACLFGQSTQIVEGNRTYREQIASSAFDLSQAGEVLANINHQERLTFARKSDSSLLLQSDARGLFASAYLPDNYVGNAILRAHALGRVTGASFSFSPIVDRTLKNMTTERVKVRLLDVCVCVDEEPAYGQTADHVHLRTKPNHNVLLSLLRYQKWKIENRYE